MNKYAVDKADLLKAAMKRAEVLERTVNAGLDVHQQSRLAEVSMMADSPEKRAKKAELRKELDRALAADMDMQAMERRARIKELQEQAAETQRQHEALQQKRLKIQAHKERGIEYLASLEIQNLGGTALRLADLEDPRAEELEAGRRALQEQARREG